MKNFKVTYTTEVKPERVIDLFITACEGGSNYWARSSDSLPGKDFVPAGVNHSAPVYSYMLNGFIIVEMCERTGKDIKHKVSATKIKNALDLMAKNYTDHFNDFLNENEDVETADIFMQLCVFGDVIYG